MSASRGTIEPTPTQKAAIIIAILGPEAAKPIVDKLDDAALAKVADALSEIPFLGRDQLRTVVVDFLQNLEQTEGALRGGQARAREIIASLVDASRLDAILGRKAATEPDDSGLGVWKRLELRDARSVAAYLDRLSPNLIAIILQKLSVQKASEIAQQLDEAKLRPTFGHMVSDKTLDAGIENVIERMVELEFLNQAGGADGENSAHLEAIGELLSLIPGGKRASLVDFLRSQFEEKLEVIEKGLFTIEGLPDMLDTGSVPVLFRELGQARMADILSALEGEFEAVANFLLGNISARMADQIREEVQSRPSPSPDKAAEIQRDFLGELMALKRDGTIVITKPDKAA